jgi:hypothetical protein
MSYVTSLPCLQAGLPLPSPTGRRPLFHHTYVWELSLTDVGSPPPRAYAIEHMRHTLTLLSGTPKKQSDSPTLSKILILICISKCYAFAECLSRFMIQALHRVLHHLISLILFHFFALHLASKSSRRNKDSPFVRHLGALFPAALKPF